MTKAHISKIAVIVALLLGASLAAYTYYHDKVIEERTRVAKPTYVEMTSFVAVLENEAQNNHQPLQCFELDASYNFVDQWGNPLKCSVEDHQLFIKSAGEDGKFDTSDDLAVRRRIP